MARLSTHTSYKQRHNYRSTATMLLNVKSSILVKLGLNVVHKVQYLLDHLALVLLNILIYSCQLHFLFILHLLSKVILGASKLEA